MLVTGDTLTLGGATIDRTSSDSTGGDNARNVAAVFLSIPSYSKRRFGLRLSKKECCRGKRTTLMENVFKREEKTQESGCEKLQPDSC